MQEYKTHVLKLLGTERLKINSLLSQIQQINILINIHTDMYICFSRIVYYTENLKFNLITS